MESIRPSVHALSTQPRPSLITIAHVVYALHAISLGIGAWTAATMVGSFLFGWPSILAVVLNYAMRNDTRGTWLESHFSWQIRTFWWALVWSVAIAVISAPLTIVGIGFLLWPAGFSLLGIWAIIRTARGWLRLRDAAAMGV